MTETPAGGSVYVALYEYGEYSNAGWGMIGVYASLETAKAAVELFIQQDYQAAVDYYHRRWGADAIYPWGDPPTGGWVEWESAPPRWEWSFRVRHPHHENDYRIEVWPLDAMPVRAS